MQYISQGSGKSTFCKLLKDLIDPSLTPLLSLPHDDLALSQQIVHHYLPIYDNLRTLPDWASDEISRAVTGSGTQKRRLYTDDDVIIYQYQRAFVLNGINIPVISPDLLDRAILVNLDRIPADKRKEERKIRERFAQDKPYILGAIFTALSKALKKEVKLPYLPRMADFCRWGYAVADVLGIGGHRFLQAYSNNIQAQNLEVIEGNPVAMTVCHFIEQRPNGKWTGTASDLLEKLNEVAKGLKLNTKSKGWPQQPNILTRKLNVLKPNLQEVGILYEVKHTRKGTEIYLTRKVVGKTVTTVTPSHSPINQTKMGDDENQISSPRDGVSSPRDGEVVMCDDRNQISSHPKLPINQQINQQSGDGGDGDGIFPTLKVSKKEKKANPKTEDTILLEGEEWTDF